MLPCSFYLSFLEFSKPNQRYFTLYGTAKERRICLKLKSEVNLNALSEVKHKSVVYKVAELFIVENSLTRSPALSGKKISGFGFNNRISSLAFVTASTVWDRLTLGLRRRFVVHHVKSVFSEPSRTTDR